MQEGKDGMPDLEVALCPGYQGFKGDIRGHGVPTWYDLVRPPERSTSACARSSRVGADRLARVVELVVLARYQLGDAELLASAAGENAVDCSDEMYAAAAAHESRQPRVAAIPHQARLLVLMLAEGGGAPSFAGTLGGRARLCLGPLALVIVWARRRAHCVREPPIATGDLFRKQAREVTRLI